MELFTYLLPKILMNLSIFCKTLSFYCRIFPFPDAKELNLKLAQLFTGFMHSSSCIDLIFTNQLNPTVNSGIHLSFQNLSLPLRWCCNEPPLNSCWCWFWRELEKFIPVAPLFNPVNKGFGLCFALTFLFFSSKWESNKYWLFKSFSESDWSRRISFNLDLSSINASETFLLWK